LSKLPDKKIPPSDLKIPKVHTQPGASSPMPCHSPAPPKSAEKPQWITILLGALSPAIAVVALFVAFFSWHTSDRSMKVGQRAYLTYQVVGLDPWAETIS
jgi:hypothetical protein